VSAALALTVVLAIGIGVSLGLLGGGGSILAVPALVYAAGQDARLATASSLVLVGTASLFGMVSHWRAGRVRVVTGLAFGAAGIGGSLAGSALNRRLDPDLLLLGFAVLVVVAAWRMLVGCPTCTKVGEAQAMATRRPAAGDTALDADAAPGTAVSTAPSTASSNAGTAAATGAATATTTLPRTGLRHRPTVATVVKVLAAGTAVGFLTGLFGVGGGFVIVPALALVLELPMPIAIGTSLLVIAVNSGVALASRLATTSIDWAVTAPFTIAAIAGVLTGGRIADRLDPERSLRWFAALLVGVAIYTGTRAGLGLAA
jgi:uncharacterized membrane protein YfcA